MPEYEARHKRHEERLHEIESEQRVLRGFVAERERAEAVLDTEVAATKARLAEHIEADGHAHTRIPAEGVVKDHEARIRKIERSYWIGVGVLLFLLPIIQRALEALWPK